MKEKTKLSYNFILYASCFIIIGAPLGIFTWAYLNGEIQNSDQLLTWLGIFGIIFVGAIGENYLTKKQNQFIKDNQEELSSEEVKRARKKWAINVTPIIFFGLILTFSQLRYEKYIERTESSGLLFLFGFLGVYLVGKICIKLSPLSRKHISPENYLVLYFFIFIFYFFSIPMTIAHINITNTKEGAKAKKSVLINGAWRGLNSSRRYCYSLKHWDRDEKFSSISFCTNEFPRIKEGDEVEFVVKHGNLGILYVDEIVFSNHRNFATYISSIGGEKNLRYADILLLEKIKGRNYHDHISKHWKENCNETTPYKCRLASYRYSLTDQKGKAIKLLRKGCSLNEFTSCHGLYLNSSKKRKDIAKKILKLCLNPSNLQEDSKNICIWYQNKATTNSNMSGLEARGIFS